MKQKERQRLWYLKNRERISEQGKIARQDPIYRNAINQRRREYYKKNPSRELKQKKLYRTTNKEMINNSQRFFMKRSYYNDKMIVYQHYSRGVPQCACCGELIYEFLTIDHIISRKNIHHDKSFIGHKLYRWLINNNFPDGFQVLCCNCNFARGRRDGDGICPHQKIIKQTLFPDISK